jgi:hypothetical protein
MNRNSVGLLVALVAMLLGLGATALWGEAQQLGIPTLRTPRLPQLKREIPKPSHLMCHLSMRGNANDVSGNNNHGLVIGAILTADRFGRAERAYDFNGRGAYIELANERNFDLHTFTIAMHLRISAWPVSPNPAEAARYTLISKGEHGGNFTVEISKAATAPYGSLSYSQRTLGGTPAGGSVGTIGLHRFHHLAVTGEGPILRLYIDGQLKFEKIDLDPRLLNDAPVMVGRSADTVSPNWFRGTIDDVRIYTRPLSAPEIYQLMAEPENQ